MEYFMRWLTELYSGFSGLLVSDCLVRLRAVDLRLQQVQDIAEHLDKMSLSIVLRLHNEGNIIVYRQVFTGDSYSDTVLRKTLVVMQIL